MGRRPDWDDPVIGVALVANGWVLLLGHGIAQVRFLCQQEGCAKDPPLDLTGWSRSPAAEPEPGRDNGGFQRDTDRRRGVKRKMFMVAKFDMIILLNT